MEQFDVIIAGGGMVGMSLAVALARQEMRVCVVEQEAMRAQLEPQFDGRVSAIALASKNILANIGVWEAMAPQAQAIYDIRVSDGDAPFFLHYDHHEIGEAPFGYIVENRHIRHALQQAAALLPTLTIIERAAVEGFTQDDLGVTVQTKGRELRARALLAADGKHSRIRATLGIATTDWVYEQTAIVCTIEHEHPHEGLAQERFLPAGPFAVLPMCQNRSSLVWVEPTERLAAYIDLPDEEFAQEISERVGGYLGVLRPVGRRFSYPLSLMHARDYVRGRVALLGDAAHAIHPIAGQGVNLGFRDVAVLAELMGEAFARGEDIGSLELLSHYQRWRRFDNVTMLAVTDGLTRLFSNAIPPIKLARGLGLWVVGKMPSLKQFFMRQAIGLEGDVPKLAQLPKKQYN